jgi:hypothetical protein
MGGEVEDNVLLHEVAGRFVTVITIGNEVISIVFFGEGG